MLLKITSIFFILFFASCGYKPISAQKTLNEELFIKVFVNDTYQYSSALFKQSIVKSFSNKLNIINNENAKNKIFIHLTSVSFAPLEYDDKNFIIRKQAKVVLKATLFNNNKNYGINSEAKSDFYLDPSAKSVSFNEEEGVLQASLNAGNILIEKIIAQGLFND